MKMKARGGNLPRIKVTNQFLIREMVYRKGPISRIEVAKELGLTLPTITTNVNIMIDRGFLQEVSGPVKMNSLGRHTMLIDVVPNSRIYLGVEVRGSLRRAVLVNLRGKVIDCISDNTMFTDYHDALDNAVSIAKTLMRRNGRECGQIDAIGVCTPGLVDSQRGVLIVHPGYQWEQKPIGEDFARSLDYSGSVYIENNSIARAFAMNLFNPEVLNGASSFAYMFVSSGIACPLLNDTKKHFGVVSGDGEVGHMVMNPNGPECTCGNHGCLETYSSETTIIRKATVALIEGRAPVLGNLVGHDGNPTIGDLIEAQKGGDPAVSEIVSEAIKYLGLAIANIDNFVKPECVAIECRLFDNPGNRDLLMNEINRNLYRKTFNDYRFSFIQSNEYSGAKGAAAVAIKNDLENYIE